MTPAADRAPRDTEPNQARPIRPPAGYLVATAVAVVTALALLPFRDLLNTIDAAMVLLLAVVVVSAVSRRGPALYASALAILAFDVLFVPPYYRLTVDDADYLLTFGVMLVVAVLMSGLTTRIREQAEAASESERRTRARFTLNQDLASVVTADQVIEELRAALEAIVGVPGQVALAQEHGPGERQPDWPTDGVFADTEVRLAASLAVLQHEITGHGTTHGADADALVMPLTTRHRNFGVIAFPTARANRVLSPAELRLAGAVLEEGMIALDRAYLTEEHEAARLAVDAEQLRTSLLSSLSHDLRTPLANIEGAASSLLDPNATLAAEVRRELAEGILGESRRMHRLVMNLLDMVRVESGALAIRKTWQPLEEALGVALLRLDERLAGRDVQVRLPPDLPLVPIDELLIEQVFINLLDNALKHTPAGTAITVSAATENGAVVAEVADRGPGLAPGEEERVFGKFYQATPGGGTIPAGGAGLGLTICRGIIAAHGGRIWAEPNPGGGVRFRFTIPLGGQPPAAPPSEASDP